MAGTGVAMAEKGRCAERAELAAAAAAGQRMRCAEGYSRLVVCVLWFVASALLVHAN
jgi:hypothetical protein